MDDPIDPTQSRLPTPSPSQSVLDHAKPDLKDQLLSRQLDELTLQLGRIPTINEATAEIGRDRTVIASALRTRRLEAERYERQAASEAQAVVESLSVQVDDLRTEIQRQGMLLLEQGRLLEAARDASWRHRRDLTNARLGMAVLARLAEVRDLDTERYGDLVRMIRVGHFSPLTRSLPDGADAKVLAGLLATGSVAATIREIAQREHTQPGTRQTSARAPAPGRPAPAAEKPAGG